MHKNLWEEMNQYIDSLIKENLSTGLEAEEAGLEEEESSNPKWVNSPNAWQIGNLSSSYWAKIHPSEGPLGLTYHVGYLVGKRFKWVPKNQDESLIEPLKRPCSLIWTSQDDQNVERIDTDGLLGMKKAELNNELLKDYESEFLDLGTNVRCTLKGKLYDINDKGHQDYFMPIDVFLESKDKYQLNALYSRIWTLDSFFENGKVNLEAINKYKREMGTMIPILCNTVTQLNDYALEIGINQETIKERYDRFNRIKDIMFGEFGAKYPEGTLFRPTKEENQNWRLYAKDELGVESNYLYDMIHSKYRFKGRGLTREEES